MGGKSPDTNAYLKAKLKVSVFENGQFSGHLIFAKKTFFSEKKIFYPDKQELCFFEKNNVHFFEKKSFFWKCLCEKIEKTFPKKRFKKKKINIVVFQKNKVLVY